MRFEFCGAAATHVGVVDVPGPTGVERPVCLSFGDHCETRYCPVFSVECFEMGYRFAQLPAGRSALLKTVARCAICARDATMVIVGTCYLFCLSCETLAPRHGLLRREPEVAWDPTPAGPMACTGRRDLLPLSP